MDKNDLLEELKKVVAGVVTSVPKAEEEEVTPTVSARFDSQSGRLLMDVTLQAAEGITIENFGNGLVYFLDGGKGHSGASRSVRGWGVAEGSVIQSGIDIAVAEKGSHAARWSIGTFVRTGSGYKLWTKSGDFEFKA